MGDEPRKSREVTVDGITVVVSIDPADDYELTELMVTRFDTEASDVERAKAMLAQNRLVLGKDYERVKAELRERHGGTLSNAVMGAFVTRVIRGARELKNS